MFLDNMEHRQDVSSKAINSGTMAKCEGGDRASISPGLRILSIVLEHDLSTRVLFAVFNAIP